MTRQPIHGVNIKDIEEGTLLLELSIKNDHDTLLARQRMKQIARMLGFRSQAQTQMATASTEIVRNALNHGETCTVRFYVAGDEHPLTFWIIVQDMGPGLSQETLDQSAGINSARHLVDRFHFDSRLGQGTTVFLGKRLRKHRLSEHELLVIVDKISRAAPRSTLKEAQDQNRELMVTLEALRRANARESLRAREWQATFDAIPDALFILDNRCLVLRVNRAAVALMDRSEDDMIGQPWEQLSPFEKVADPDGDVIELAKRSRCRKARNQKLHNRWYRMQVDVLLDDEANLVHRFVLLIVDITEEKRAIDRLSHINEALKTYAHSISHDIKGPLAGALTANQVLQQLLKQPLTDKSRTSIQELGDLMSTSIKKTLALINEVLALAETGVGPGGATNINRVINRVLEDWQERIQKQSITVRASNLGQVIAAPAHLYQVFANLIDNAIKHANRSGLTIRIKRLETSEDGLHRFLFRDNGPGIPSSLLDHIFTSFVRGDRSVEGSGIGLATVKRIVETYAGSIRAYNDNGACFEIEIRDAVD